MEEAMLVRRATLGDEAALETLVETYYPGILAFCYRRTGERTLAEDLTQDTFVKMATHLPRYQESGRFKSWLFTIAANTCRDAARKKRPTGPLLDSLPDEKADGFVQSTENGAVLAAALQGLPGAQRECILLQYYHGFTAQEIAGMLGIPYATVKTRLYRGLVRLRHSLGQEVLLEH